MGSTGSGGRRTGACGLRTGPEPMAGSGGGAPDGRRMRGDAAEICGGRGGGFGRPFGVTPGSAGGVPFTPGGRGGIAICAMSSADSCIVEFSFWNSPAGFTF